MTDTLLSLPTNKLQAGDIVYAGGNMRVRLDTLRTYHGGHYWDSGRYSHDSTTGKCSAGYGPAGTDSCCVVYSWSGTVLNLADVREYGVVPMSWLRTDDGRDDHWTIQGNYLATWTVQRADCSGHRGVVNLDTGAFNCSECTSAT